MSLSRTTPIRGLLRGTISLRLSTRGHLLLRNHRIPPPQLLTPKHLRLHSSSSQPPLQARITTPLLILILLSSGLYYYTTTSSSPPPSLNPTTFTPYTITSREQISPSSFIFTITPQTPLPSPPTPSGLWSVEFKQPEVQIARHYTPLPPNNTGDDKKEELSFYIRALNDGEMSTYLSRRRVTDPVFLRGPHASFDLTSRLGSHDRLVFLAGGTGVVPGMQAARAVLDARPEATVSLLWAVRTRAEIQDVPETESVWRWKFWEGKKPFVLEESVEQPSPIARRLAQMKAEYGERLSIQAVIDEEGTRFTEGHIKNALALTSPFPAPISVTGCHLHDQRMHERTSEFTSPEEPSCVCKSSDGTVPGKNLFIVSGPDGFVTYYAGEKVWLGGHQTQGAVGGVAAQLQRQHPQLAQDWLVLKL